MGSNGTSVVRRVLNTARIASLARRERRIPWWSAERVRRFQQRRLRSMARHAYDTTAFYRRAMDERGLRPEDFTDVSDLARLPLVDDMDVRKNLDDLISSAYKDGPLQAVRTGGAYTRVRKTIYWDDATFLSKIAFSERDRAVLTELAGRDWGQVQLYILPDESVSLQLRRFWDERLLVPRRLAERHYLVSEEPFEKAAELINDLRPGVVFTYGSYTDEFFRYAADRDIEIAPPRVWMYGGDMLSDHGRDLAEARFGIPIYTTYQMVETGKIGFQCERREGFHLNVDRCPVRVIDEQGRTLPAGQRGEIVVSNLVNRATVLLNYRTGDLGTLSDTPCPCGRSLPILERLEGKINDVIHLPDGGRLIAGSVELLFKHELADTLQGQLTQRADGCVLWRIVPLTSTDCEALQRRLLEKTGGVLGPDVPVSVEFVDDIPHTRTGKFHRIVSYAASP
jgi:phenylacetate-CoA ligase